MAGKADVRFAGFAESALISQLIIFCEEAHELPASLAGPSAIRTQGPDCPMEQWALQPDAVVCMRGRWFDASRCR